MLFGGFKASTLGLRPHSFKVVMLILCYSRNTFNWNLTSVDTIDTESRTTTSSSLLDWHHNRYYNRTVYDLGIPKNKYLCSNSINRFAPLLIKRISQFLWRGKLAKLLRLKRLLHYLGLCVICKSLTTRCDCWGVGKHPPYPDELSKIQY